MLRDNCATHKVSVSMYLVSLAAHARGVFAAVHQSCAAECMVTKALRENIRRRKRNSAVLHGALPVLPAPSPKVSVSTTQFEARQAFGKHLPRFDYRTNPRMHTLPFNGQVATHAYIAVQWTGCNTQKPVVMWQPSAPGSSCVTDCGCTTVPGQHCGVGNGTLDCYKNGQWVIINQPVCPAMRFGPPWVH